MLLLGDLLKLKVRNEVEKFLKPWWDTVVDYIILSVVMVAVVTGVIGLYATGSICIPVLRCPTSEYASPNKIEACAMLQNSSAFEINSHGVATIVLKLPYKDLFPYFNSKCSDCIFVLVRIFPHVLIVMAGGCLLCSNAWFVLKSSTLEQFTDLLREYYKHASTLSAAETPIPPSVPQSMPCIAEMRAFLNASEEHAILVEREKLHKKLAKFLQDFRKNGNLSCKNCLNFGMKRSYVIIFAVQLIGCILIFVILLLVWLLFKKMNTEYECNVDEIIPGLVYDYFNCSNSIHKVYYWCAKIFFVLIILHIAFSIRKLAWLSKTDFEKINGVEMEEDFVLLFKLVESGNPAYWEAFWPIYEESWRRGVLYAVTEV